MARLAAQQKYYLTIIERVCYMKTRTILLVTLSFTVGFTTAVFWETSVSNYAEYHATINTLQNTADIVRRSLRDIRVGDTNVVPRLEAVYDTTIIALGKKLAETPEANWDQGVLRTLELARDYRQEFPRKSPMPDVDLQVLKAFTLLDRSLK